MTTIFVSWQLKTTVFLLFLAECLGNERFVDFHRNDIKEWHRYRIEHHGRVDLSPLNRDQTQDDDNVERSFENFERLPRREVFQDHPLSKETHRVISKPVERQQISDVTRYLDNSIDKRREAVSDDARQSLRQMNDRAHVYGTKKQSDANAQLEERIVDRDASRHSEDNRKKHHNLQQVDNYDLNRRTNAARERQVEEAKRYISRQQDDYEVRRHASRRSQYDNDERTFPKERVLERRDEKESEGDEGRYLSDKHKECMRRITKSENQRYIPTFSKCNHEDYTDTLRRFDDESTRERVEILADSRRLDDREPSVDREYISNQFDDSKTQLEFRRHLVNIADLERKRLENKHELDERYENLRRFDYHDRSFGRLENNRIEYQETINDVTFLRRAERLLSDPQRSDEQVLQRREKAKRHNELSERNNEFKYIVERKSIQPFDEQKYEKGQEVSRRFLDRVKQIDFSRRLDFVHDSQGRNLRLSRGEHKSVIHVEDNKSERLNRQLTARRLEERKVLDEDSRLLEDIRVERRDTLQRLYGSEIERDVNRYSQCEEQQITSRRIDGYATQLDINGRSDDSYNPISSNGQLYLGERGSAQRMRKYEEKRSDRHNDHKTYRDTNTHLEDDNRESGEINQQYYNTRDTLPLSEEISLRKEMSIPRNIHTRERVQRVALTRRLGVHMGDSRESFHNEDTFEDPIANRRVDSKLESLYPIERVYKIEYESLQKHRNNLSIPEYYPQEPNILLRNSFIFLGQSVILTYITIKALNGKTDVKNQLSGLVREAMDVICF